MPHLRKRYLQEVVEKAAQLSPLVGILGHRQVGKTTLLDKISSKYLTLDDEETYRTAKNGPRAFLEAHAQARTGIDECQLLPSLFPALKERVRKTPRPGLYFLSGSVRFTSRTAIRESLTGRIVNLELLPFTVGEMESEPLSDFLPRFQSASSLLRFNENPSPLSRRRKLHQRMETYLKLGGLPGTCFIREESFRLKKVNEQLLTILDRDIRLVYSTSLPVRQILDYVQALAARQGQPLSFSDLRRETGISPVTQHKLLGALEAVYILRLVPLAGKRRGWAVWFEDQAEVLSLSRQPIPQLEQWTGLAYRHLRTQFAYRLGSDTRVFQYHSSSGNHVPFAFENDRGIVGLIPAEEERPSRSALGTAQSFLRAYASSKVIIFHPGLDGKPHAFDDRTWISPLVDLI